MKKIEHRLIKAAFWIWNNARPNIFTLLLFIICVQVSLLINKTRKKTPEEIQEEKLHNEAFNKIFFNHLTNTP